MDTTLNHYEFKNDFMSAAIHDKFYMLPVSFFRDP